jgi:hypothetical protein
MRTCDTFSDRAHHRKARTSIISMQRLRACKDFCGLLKAINACVDRVTFLDARCAGGPWSVHLQDHPHMQTKSCNGKSTCQGVEALAYKTLTTQKQIVSRPKCLALALLS